MQKVFKKIYCVIRNIYVFILARPSMQGLNNIVLKLALHGAGYRNHGFVDTGEKKLIEILKLIKPTLCIDIGANVGMYSLELLKNTDSKIICFEPLAEAFNKLCEIQKRNLDRMQCYNMGVGDKEGELEIGYDEGDSEHASFSNEVNTLIAKKNKNKKMVYVTTLDEFVFNRQNIQKIDFIKIDTEGFEYEVLVGAGKTISEMKPKLIQIEFNSHQLVKSHSLYKLSQLMPDYEAYQLLPYGEGLKPIDVMNPLSNIYEYSNFIFVSKDARKYLK